MPIDDRGPSGIGARGGASTKPIETSRKKHAINPLLRTAVLAGDKRVGRTMELIRQLVWAGKLTT